MAVDPAVFKAIPYATKNWRNLMEIEDKALRHALMRCPAGTCSAETANEISECFELERPQSSNLVPISAIEYTILHDLTTEYDTEGKIIRGGIMIDLLNNIFGLTCRYYAPGPNGQESHDPAAPPTNTCDDPEFLSAGVWNFLKESGAQELKKRMTRLHRIPASWGAPIFPFCLIRLSVGGVEYWIVDVKEDLSGVLLVRAREIEVRG